MALKIKESYTDTEIWVGPNNSNIICKFIEKGLYPYLYNIYPHIFEEEVQEVISESILFDEVKPAKKEK